MAAVIVSGELHGSWPQCRDRGRLGRRGGERRGCWGMKMSGGGGFQSSELTRYCRIRLPVCALSEARRAPADGRLRTEIGGSVRRPRRSSSSERAPARTLSAFGRSRARVVCHAVVADQSRRESSERVVHATDVMCLYGNYIRGVNCEDRRGSEASCNRAFDEFIKSQSHALIRTCIGDDANDCNLLF